MRHLVRELTGTLVAAGSAGIGVRLFTHDADLAYAVVVIVAWVWICRK